MDPNATFRQMTDAFDSGDYATAYDAANSLLVWLVRGGFPPEGKSTTEAVDACKGMLDSSALMIDE